MNCDNCKSTFKNVNKKICVIFQCCHSVCTNCLNQSRLERKCIKCNQFITNTIIKKVSFGSNQSDEIKIYKNKYEELCFLDSGSFGCVYVIRDIENNKT